MTRRTPAKLPHVPHAHSYTAPRVAAPVRRQVPAVPALPGGQPAATREEVGARLRSLRKQRKMTLKMLSEQSGIALSTISKLELGHIAVSYEKFAAIARTLGIDSSHLFEGSHSQQVSARPTFVKSSPANTSEYVAGSYSYRMLSGEFPSKTMTPMWGQVSARTKSQFQDFIRHPGEEFIMVLAGTVRIEFETGESVTLKRQESAYFDSGIGHLYLSTGRGDAQIVVVCTE